MLREQENNGPRLLRPVPVRRQGEVADLFGLLHHHDTGEQDVPALQKPSIQRRKQPVLQGVKKNRALLSGASYTTVAVLNYYVPAFLNKANGHRFKIHGTRHKR